VPVMKYIRLALGIIGIATATIAAMAQQQPAPPAPPAVTGAQPQAAIDSPLLRSYSPVTKARLLKPEDRNWLQIRRSYDGWGYSPLDKITPANVSRLKLVWSAKTDEVGAHQAPPLVNNGVMFISTPNNQVAAYDAKTGTLLWRYKRVRPATAFVAHPSNRGLALYGDKVYYGAGEAVVVALDARTGKEVWAREVYDNTYRYYITMAPLAAREDSRRRIRRRVRRARVCRGPRSRDGQGDLARVHGARTGTAGQRDMAERRSVEDGRSVGLGNGQLRSRNQSRLLWYR